METKRRHQLHLFPPLLCLVTLFTLLIPTFVFGADIGNCLLCHKYPGLTRVDEKGQMRLMYVNEALFAQSVHAKVKCEGCHTDINKIPHDPAKKVNCLIECHIIEPSSEKKFTHAIVQDVLDKSVHAKHDKDGKPKQFDEDMPTCKDCHDNPLYRPLAFFKTARAGISEKALGRCRVCHKSDEFIYRFYNHVSTRMHKSRSPLNIAQMCGRCHDKSDLLVRHKLKTRAFTSYKETYHGKAASLLDEKVPDCLDCHVIAGKSVHEMLSYKDPQSSVHPDNKGKTCAVADCHPNATPRLAEYKTHPEFNLINDPVEYYFTLFFYVLTGGTLLPLMGIIFLDLVRRLFPHAEINFRKNERKEKGRN